MTEGDEADLEQTLTTIAGALDDALTSIYGSERGFIIYICQGEPGEGGDGIMLSNIDSSEVKGVMRDAMETMGEARPANGAPRH